MAGDAQFKVMNGVHRALLKLSFGKVGYKVSGMHVLELTTIGRKSGEPRSIMLTSPVQEGSTIVVVASRGGDPTHPAWYLNLRDNPDVTVKWRDEPAKPMRARTATAEERARLWPIITKDHRNYAGYQRKTDREIPVVLLEPVS